MADAARSSARVFQLPNYGEPPISQVKRRGRLPNAVTKISDYSYEKRRRELHKETEQQELSNIKIHEEIIAKYRERLQWSTFQLAHHARMHLNGLIAVHIESAKEAKLKLGMPTN